MIFDLLNSPHITDNHQVLLDKLNLKLVLRFI